MALLHKSSSLPFSLTGVDRDSNSTTTRSASTQTLSQDATAIVARPQLHTATVARPQLHHHAICVRSTPPRVIWVFFLRLY
ncbi:hypothetical protein AB3S75_005115 [Citrus x aurantiifolia]